MRVQLRIQRRDAASSLLPGHDFSYAFDTIGNRTNSSWFGTSAYSANALNQYSQRTVPPSIGILGTAAADTIVSADYQRMARTGEWFGGTLAANNTTAPVWKTFDIVAVRNNTGPNGEDRVASIGKTAFVAQTPEIFTHDFDGNLTSDGRWTYTWDAENRLTQMETIPTAVTAGVPKTKLEFAYDSAGRRIQKKVSNWNGTAYVLASDHRFLYDGWNLVAEFTFNPGPSTLDLVRSYVWGLDLSGSMQGAGGIGGLLAVTTHLPLTACLFPAYDGNGNVTGLVDLATSSLAARYTYGPFGEPIATTGTATIGFTPSGGGVHCCKSSKASGRRQCH